MPKCPSLFLSPHGELSIIKWPHFLTAPREANLPPPPAFYCETAILVN